MPESIAETGWATWLYRLGWCVPLLLLFMHTVLVDRHAQTWEDEVFAVSTGWSIAHGGPANLSVLGLYPRTISPERFYGPVSFQAEALLLRAFGLSPFPWRVAISCGYLLILLASLFLLRTLGADRWTQWIGSTATTAISLYTGSLLPGRWDPVTIGLLMLGLALMLSAPGLSRPAQLLRSIAAGIVFGLAIGSTPRTLPILFSIGVGIAAAAWIDKAERKGWLLASLVAVLSTVAVHWALLAPLGMTPWSWFQFVRQASHGDPINSSPLLGGSWNLGLESHLGIELITLLLFVTGAIAIAHSVPNARSSRRIALTIAALLNLALDLLLVSRALSQAIFWLPPLCAAALCWVDWKALRTPRLKYMVAALLCLEFLIPVAVEAQREAAALRPQRSGREHLRSALIHNFIAPGSVVFGPLGGYFFQVEQDGSRYLYLEEMTTPGLSSNADSPAYRRHGLDLVACAHQVYAVWPRPGAGEEMQVAAKADLPAEIEQYGKVELNQSNPSDPISIFKLQRPQNCPAADSEVLEIHQLPALP
jgi:hypothetical protein